MSRPRRCRAPCFRRHDRRSRSLAQPATRDAQPDGARPRPARATLERLAAQADAELLPAASVTRLAFALSRLGNRSVAISLLRRTQRVHPNGFWVNCDLGRELKDTGQFDEAIRFFSIAVAVRPQSEIALTDLGSVLQKGGRLEEAAATIRRAIQVRPDSAWAHAALGSVLLEQGHKSDALAEFRQAKSRNPKDFFIRITIADSLLSHGDWNAAIADIKEAIHDDPRNAFFHDKLGMTLFDMGRFDESIRSFQEAIRVSKHPFPPFHGNLGRALLSNGDLAAAIASFRRASELGPPESGRPHSVETQLRDAQRLAALEPRLAAVLRGVDHPSTAAECADFARLAAIKGNHAKSVQLWIEAFAMQPDLASDVNARNRFSAACSAAIASESAGKSLPPAAADRDRFRKQAIDWLNAELDAYSELLKDTRPSSRDLVRKRLAPWRVILPLESLRTSPPEARSPELERIAIRNLWSRVDALSRQAKSHFPVVEEG